MQTGGPTIKVKRYQFDEFRRRQERRRRRIVVRFLDALTALALLAVVGFVLKMIY